VCILNENESRLISFTALEWVAKNTSLSNFLELAHERICSPEIHNSVMLEGGSVLSFCCY